MRRGGLFLGLFLVLLAGCQKEEETIEIRKTCESVKAAVRGIYRLESAVTPKVRPQFVSLDVAGLSAAQLREKLLAFTNAPAAHVWMPGEKNWIIVQHASAAQIRLSWAMEALADDAACMLSLPEVFASYAGTLSEILPAFESRLEGEVVPEWFVTKEIPKIAWLDTVGVDADILKTTLAEIRSMQVVRRLVLEGMMASRMATDRKSEEHATDKWSRAMKRNPSDSMLLERLDTLEKNARGFLEVGKVLQAMRCYETMILINPKDAVAVHNFGVCLRKIGRVDLANEVLKHAEEQLSK